MTTFLNKTMQRLINPVVLAFCACAMLAGCASQPVTHAIPAQVAVNDDRPDYDYQTIYDYQSLYKYLATRELKEKYLVVNEVTPDCVFKLAAESCLKMHRFESNNPVLYSAQLNYSQMNSKGECIDHPLISPAGGNGVFYFFIPVKNQSKVEDHYVEHFRLVGVAYGNSYNVAYSNSVPRIVAHAHISAREIMEYVYAWNGEWLYLVSKEVLTEKLEP